MTAADDAVRVLSIALDQAGDVLAEVHPGSLGSPTPCHEWTVGELVDHLVAAPVKFAQVLKGEEPDWTAAPEPVREGWAAVFRNRADDLRHLWHQRGEDTSVSADWQTAEFAVHTWDLATALGRGTDDLDPEVAEHGLAFMRENLTADRRGGAFGPEQSAHPAANAYDRIAAYAGRAVG